MRPAWNIGVHASVAATALLALALGACAASAPSVGEASASDETAFARCGAASITVDRATRYQAPIAAFLEQARTSGCSYGGIQIAFAPEEARGEAPDHDDAAAVARDFVDAFDLAWRIVPETNDPSLSADRLRVTLLAPNAFAAAQSPQYR